MKNNWLTEIPFAHRGLHGPATGHVENSLSAFKAANDRGHGFELDILLSQDGQAMVFHDLSLDRLTGKPGAIDDYPADQLKKFRLTGSEDLISPLRDVLRQVDRTLPILIEIKGDQDRPEAVAAAVHAEVETYRGPLAVMSFYPDIVDWFQQHAPQIPRGLVATSLNDDSLPDRYFSPARQISWIGELAADFIAYDIQALPNDVTRYGRSRGIPVLTWTVRSAEQRDKARQNADNIIYETAGRTPK